MLKVEETKVDSFQRGLAFQGTELSAMISSFEDQDAGSGRECSWLGRMYTCNAEVKLLPHFNLGLCLL